MRASNNRLLMRLESVAHVLMGYFAGLVGLHLLLTWREFGQLPPENDRYPVRYISTLLSGEWTKAWFTQGYDPGAEEYWPKVRVMDTLQDSMEYVVGYSTATMTHLALIIWLAMR